MAKKNAVQNEIDDPFAMFAEEFAEEEEEAEPTPEPDPELEELREFKAQAEKDKREAEIVKTFEEVGLPTKAARLFAALNPEGDVTAQIVQEFAAEYGIPPEERPSGYTPTVIGHSEPPRAKTFSRAEMEVIARDNPARAQRLAEQGRVRWNSPDQIGGKR